MCSIRGGGVDVFEFIIVCRLKITPKEVKKTLHF